MPLSSARLGRRETCKRLGENRGQFLYALGGQLALAFGEAQDRPLFTQVQGKGERSGYSLWQLAGVSGAFAIDHQGAGGQVAKAFEGGMLQATDGAKKVAERQHVDKTQQVADQ